MLSTQSQGKAKLGNLLLSWASTQHLGAYLNAIRAYMG
jgi:hypothetical protein